MSILETLTGWGEAAWNWATSNADTIYNASRDFTQARVSEAEREALMNYMYQNRGTQSPDLSGYGTAATRSTAGVAGFGDIREASQKEYATFLYFAKSHLQAKKGFEGTVPPVLKSKTGLGSRTVA
jgi:hypothetical protein